MKAWLSQKRIVFEERLLLEQPPSRKELGVFAKLISGGAEAMVTPMTNFPEYQEYVAGRNLSEEQLLDTLAQVPNLLKKPILVDQDRVILGTSDPKLIGEFVGTDK